MLSRILSTNNVNFKTKIEGMYQTCDKDGDGKVTCEEFLKLM
jgi:Ca2+-binding EF-hand superfamily protein